MNLNRFNDQSSGRLITLMIISLPLFFSCGTDTIDEIKNIPNITDMPSMSAENMNLLRSQDGKINIRVLAKTVNAYTLTEGPKTEFPHGILVEFFNDSMLVTSYLSADRAVYFEKEKRWEAYGKVEAKNEQGTVFNTEYLEWDEEKEAIQTEKYIQVTDKDGIIVGRGFRAKQDFTDWEILKPTGVFNVDQKDFIPPSNDE